jgi:raffinose/stachyose/melibiose transport system substrate-binding protein
MKKITFLVLALLLVLAVGSLQAQDSVTLTYMASQGWVPDAEIELGAQFEEETGIHVDYQIIPADQYFTVLQTRLNTGEATDLFGGQSGVTDLIVNYNIEANGVDLSDQAWAKQIDPLVAAQATVNDKVYGLTLWDVTGTTWVINYSKTIFEEQNLSVPTSYEEFKSACEVLLGTDIIPIFEPVASGWHHVLWFPELGPRYEEVTPGLAEMLNKNETTFAEDPTMLAVVEQLKELYDMGCFGDNALADTTEFTTEALGTGQYAMGLTNLTGPQAIVNDYPDVDPESFGFFVMPLADNQNLNINPAGPTKFIYSGSEHIDEAKQYLDFLTRPENLQYLIDNNPAFRTLPFAGLTFDLLPSQQEFLDSFPPEKRGTVYQTAVNYVNPQWMDIGQDLTAMFIGDIEPIEVLEKIDKRRAEMAVTAQDPAWSN